MLGSIYTAQSGLQAFSRGLDTISNNVANLNTPGHKANDLMFQDAFYKYLMSGDYENNFPGAQFGNGVKAELTNIVFTQGELQASGNETDAAIDGNGFFILRERGETYYTRGGQFEFDDDGYLVARGSEARVGGLGAGGGLTDITLNGRRSDPANPTSEIRFVNNLSTGSQQHVIEDVEVFDTVGESHELTFTFINDSPRVWLVEIRDEDDNLISSGEEIRFAGDGSPEEGWNSITFTFSPADTDPSDITLFFGDPGSLTGATSFSGGSTSDLAVESQDGYGVGSLTGVEFNRDGVLELSYSNGQTHDGPQLALARFENLQRLVQLSGGRFLPQEGQSPQIGAAAQSGLGEIVGGNVELSNVELTQQFTDMIIVQRGYQASSQIVTVANEMIQQLMDMLRAQR